MRGSVDWRGLICWPGCCGRRLLCRNEFERGFEHLSRPTYGLADARLVDGQPCETRGVDTDVGRQHHHVRRRYIRFREHVFRPDRSLSLDLDLMAHHLRRLLQRFGSHQRMGDAGRAGCHGNDFHKRRLPSNMMYGILC
ncbi:MAG: hypothetical protein WCF57_07945 [Pyrinomonadaceae bacterium]